MRVRFSQLFYDYVYVSRLCSIIIMAMRVFRVWLCVCLLCLPVGSWLCWLVVQLCSVCRVAALRERGSVVWNRRHRAMKVPDKMAHVAHVHRGYF